MLKLHGENVFPITFQYLIIMDVVEQVSKETDLKWKVACKCFIYREQYRLGEGSKKGQGEKLQE